jgi:hypothetical protein
LLAPEQPLASHNLRLCFQVLRDEDAAVDPFLPLSRFTLFAVLRRYDEDPDRDCLDRALWNQLCDIEVCLRYLLALVQQLPLLSTTNHPAAVAEVFDLIEV